jgi:MSHA pilin protein MshC
VQKANGFTILELVLVMTVLAIISATVLFKYTGTASFNKDSIAEQLKRDIRLTQNLAVNMNTSYSITIGASSYTISPSPSSFPATTTVPSGVTLSSTPSTITFDSKGKPAASASISITTTAGVVNLSMAAETGFIP